jgi:hypothetical protein
MTLRPVYLEGRVRHIGSPQLRLSRSRSYESGLHRAHPPRERRALMERWWRPAAWPWAH